MPLGILTDEEFEQEIIKANSNGNLPNRNSQIIILEKGRGNKTETPESARKLISELAIKGADVSSIAENFNISPSSISAYKNGATSTATYDEPKADLIKHNNLVRDQIVKKSRRKLVLALNSITPDKIKDATLKEASSVAKDMSAIIKNMEPDIKPEANLNAQFIFYAPQIKKEIDYPVIDVLD